MSSHTKVVRESFFVLKFPSAYKDIGELQRFESLQEISSHLATLRASRPDSELLAGARIVRVDVKVETKTEVIEEEEG
jgi:hypothetical protein